MIKQNKNNNIDTLFIFNLFTLKLTRKMLINKLLFILFISLYFIVVVFCYICRGVLGRTYRWTEPCSQPP